MKRWPAVLASALLVSSARDAFAQDAAPVEPAEEDPTTPAPPATGNPWLPREAAERKTDHWSPGPAPKKPPVASPKPTRWYGWQTLAVDAVSTTLMVVTVAESRRPDEGAISLIWPSRLFEDPPKTSAAITGSLALYMLGPAFVHAVHGRGVQAALSPAIRAFAPTLGLMTGAVYGLAAAIVVDAVDTDNRGFDGNDPAGTVLIGCIASGYVLGFAAPMLIDAVALAREPIEPDDAADEKKTSRSFTVQPNIGWSKTGTSIGIGGTF